MLFEPLPIHICIFKNKISFKKRFKSGCEGSSVMEFGFFMVVNEDNYVNRAVF